MIAHGADRRDRRSRRWSTRSTRRGSRASRPTSTCSPPSWTSPRSEPATCTRASSRSTPSSSGWPPSRTRCSWRRRPPRRCRRTPVAMTRRSPVTRGGASSRGGSGGSRSPSAGSPATDPARPDDGRRRPPGRGRGARRRRDPCRARRWRRVGRLGARDRRPHGARPARGRRPARRDGDLAGTAAPRRAGTAAGRVIGRPPRPRLPTPSPRRCPGASCGSTCRGRPRAPERAARRPRGDEDGARDRRARRPVGSRASTWSWATRSSAARRWWTSPTRRRHDDAGGGHDRRGRPARRPAERGRGDPDRGQARLHRPPRCGRPVRDRGDVVRPSARGPAARGRGRPAPVDRPAPRRPVPGPRVPPSAASSARSPPARTRSRSSSAPRTRSTGRTSIARPRRRWPTPRSSSRVRRPARCASAATCRSPSGARTKGRSPRPPPPPSPVRLVDLGCDDIGLGDTIGAATPGDVARVLDVVLPVVGVGRIGLHAHDTRGQALANVLAALQRGVSTIDSSAGGLGGCPFAGPGAVGNLATEDLVYLLDGLGIEHGVSLDGVMAASAFIAVGRRPPAAQPDVARGRAAGHATPAGNRRRPGGVTRADTATGGHDAHPDPSPHHPAPRTIPARPRRPRPGAAVAASAGPVVAKEGFQARLDAPIGRDTPGGTTLLVGMTVTFPDGSGQPPGRGLADLPRARRTRPVVDPGHGPRGRGPAATTWCGSRSRRPGSRRSRSASAARATCRSCSWARPSSRVGSAR